MVRLGPMDVVLVTVVEDPLGVLVLVTKTVDTWLLVMVEGGGVDEDSSVRVVVPLMVLVLGAFVVTPYSVTVSLTTLDLVTGSGVMVMPTSSLITVVDVEVTSGAVMEIVAVAFAVLVLITLSPEM